MECIAPEGVVDDAAMAEFEAEFTEKEPVDAPDQPLEALLVLIDELGIKHQHFDLGQQAITASGSGSTAGCDLDGE